MLNSVPPDLKLKLIYTDNQMFLIENKIKKIRTSKGITYNYILFLDKNLNFVGDFVLWQKKFVKVETYLGATIPLPAFRQFVYQNQLSTYADLGEFTYAVAFESWSDFSKMKSTFYLPSQINLDAYCMCFKAIEVPLQFCSRQSELNKKILSVLKEFVIKKDL